MKHSKSSLIDALVGMAGMEAEHRFCKFRRWKFDIAWPERMVALEIEGGHWVRGRHTHPKGFEDDITKYNCAAMLGWRVFRTTTKDIEATARLLGEMFREGESPAAKEQVLALAEKTYVLRKKDNLRMLNKPRKRRRRKRT